MKWIQSCTKHTSLVTTTAESTTNTEMVKTVQQEKNRPLRWSKLVSACQFIEQGTHAGCGIGQVWRQDKSQNHLWVKSVKFSGHLWDKLGTVVEIIRLTWSILSMTYLKKGFCKWFVLKLILVLPFFSLSPLASREDEGGSCPSCFSWPFSSQGCS